MTCPVHALGPLVQACSPGQRLFEGISAADALRVLRILLAELGTQSPDLYRTHDLRRGHALDLQLSGAQLHVWPVPGVTPVSQGAPLWVILAAGEWKSPAFLDYLNLHRLEGDMVVQAHIAESSDEEEA